MLFGDKLAIRPDAAPFSQKHMESGATWVDVRKAAAEKLASIAKERTLEENTVSFSSMVKHIGDSAMEEGFIDALLDIYVQNGADINRFDTDGRSPLYYSVSGNQVLLTRYLLAKGVVLRCEIAENVLRMCERRYQLVRWRRLQNGSALAYVANRVAQSNPLPFVEVEGGDPRGLEGEVLYFVLNRMSPELFKTLIDESFALV